MTPQSQERRKEYDKRYYAKHPWWKSYNNARSRCLSGKYKGRIKFLMTMEDFKVLWFRDKAYLMKQPSIDRIDNNGDYILNNCRFIEMKLNQSLGGKIGIDRRIIKEGWHRDDAHYEPYKICPCCKNNFTPIKSRRIFCSVKCSTTFRNKKLYALSQSDIIKEE